MERDRHLDTGQALPLVIGSIAVLAVLVFGVAWFARSLTDAATARTAADAAALAGAVEGRTAAARFAAANGGVLLAFTQIGDDVIVTVRVGRATARARATASRSPFSTLALWPRSIDRLKPGMPQYPRPPGDSAEPVFQRSPRPTTPRI
jgi:hypothetical protein